MSFTNSVDTNNTGYCGLTSYVLEPDHAFMSITPSPSLKISLMDPEKTGVYDVTLVVSLPAYTDVTSLRVPFKVTLSCTVQEIYLLD